MHINATGYYIPPIRIHNDYFLEVNGLSSDWIFQRTGIETRTKVAEGENSFTMGRKAVTRAAEKLPYPIEEVDLIISAGYTPQDTVGTLAHTVQRDFNIPNAVSVMISSACSSCVNAIEIVEGYFAANKASKALIVCSENNSYYNDESDPNSGHLWGDAAIAMFISKEKVTENDPEILNVISHGLGHIGKGPEGVCLAPKEGKLEMPNGKDVFANATRYMIDAVNEVTAKSNVELAELDYIIAHQANMRIISNVLKNLDFPESKSLNNIRNYGNTGSASAFLVMMEHEKTFQKGNLVGITVFGGGYSSGATLIRF
ncbi:MAG: ketoacyl-ACP synthase III [Bacteroidales bacterium]|jgi:3-oxoacyl-[acyl-carrier-protein] synthase-3|nr:ketoacyl-ACP synthase III [Bacteroidales bacterium]